MRQILSFLLLFILLLSCNEKKTDYEKKPQSIEQQFKEIEKIGQLYHPEKMITRPIKIYVNSEVINYEVDLYNSEILKKDKENLKLHSNKIALLLKTYLVKSNTIYKDIIVRIYQKNEGKQSFQYSKQELIDIEKQLRSI